MSKPALGNLHFPSAGSKLLDERPKRSPFSPLGVLQGAEGRDHCEPGGTDRDRRQLGRAAPGAGNRHCQPGEPIELYGFLEGLQVRGMHGMEFVFSDDCTGLKKATTAALAGALLAALPCDFLRTRSIMCRARSMTISC
jgi:hypothetical protein